MAITLEVWLKRAGKSQAWYDALSDKQKKRVRGEAQRLPSHADFGPMPTGYDIKGLAKKIESDDREGREIPKAVIDNLDGLLPRFGYSRDWYDSLDPERQKAVVEILQDATRGIITPDHRHTVNLLRDLDERKGRYAPKDEASAKNATAKDIIGTPSQAGPQPSKSIPGYDAPGGTAEVLESIKGAPPRSDWDAVADDTLNREYRIQKHTGFTDVWQRTPMSWDEANIEVLQKKLTLAGFMEITDYRELRRRGDLGSPESMTRIALAKALEKVRDTGLPLDDLLTRAGAGEDLDSIDQPEQYQPEAFTAAAGADLRSQIKNAFKEEVGRAPTKAEMAKYERVYRNMERRVYDQTQAFSKAKFDAGERMEVDLETNTASINPGDTVSAPTIEQAASPSSIIDEYVSPTGEATAKRVNDSFEVFRQMVGA